MTIFLFQNPYESSKAPLLSLSGKLLFVHSLSLNLFLFFQILGVLILICKDPLLPLTSGNHLRVTKQEIQKMNCYSIGIFSTSNRSIEMKFRKNVNFVGRQKVHLPL